MARFSESSIDEIIAAITGDATNLQTLADAVQTTAGEFTQSEADERYAPISVAIQTVLVAGAISPSVPVTYLSGASGAYAVTLAAPAAGMIGKTKLIEYTVGAGVVTLNDANIDSTSPESPTLDTTFDTVGQCIVLVGAKTRWLLHFQNVPA